MGIPSHSGFQDPPKVGLSDVISFQLGAKALQASFAKALQEPDAESVVIVNLHQPIQSPQGEMSHAKVIKNAEEKRTSLNEQIRDIIRKSIQAGKRSTKARTNDSTEDKGEDMFLIDRKRSAHKQLEDQNDKIREDRARKVSPFDATMRSSSYRSSLDTDFIQEPKQKPRKSRENSEKALPSQGTFAASEKKEPLPSTYDAEFIDNALTRDAEEKIESIETLSTPTSSIHAQEQSMQPIAPPPPSVTTIASSSSISPHCIMSLPPDFFELFEKLVGVMIIEQNTSGITEVTVTINRPGSILDKSEVFLQFFDTNPRSCNVELRGSPEAVRYFHKYHGEFVAAFRESKLSLDVNIRGPALLPNKKIIKRKK